MKAQRLSTKILQTFFIFIILLSKNSYSAEEAKYKILNQISDNIEIRLYPKMILVTHQEDKDQSNNNFRALFDYISGNNARDEKIKMTIPVFKNYHKQTEIMSFVMPSKYDLKTLPKAVNKNLKIRILKNKKYIALRFSGRSIQRNFNKHQLSLEKIVKEKNIKANIKKPIYAYYNAPWVLPIFKRNEVMFEIKN